jgi:hypothetical protein
MRTDCSNGDETNPCPLLTDARYPAVDTAIKIEVPIRPPNAIFSMQPEFLVSSRLDNLFGVTMEDSVSGIETKLRSRILGIRQIDPFF